MKIICIGRNYANHAKELKNPLPEKPVFFLKPETSLLLRNKPFYYPEFSKEIHYETELVFKINRNRNYIQEKFADKYYGEVALGVDFTARDIQKECKANGLPWEIAKGFDHSAPLSEFIDLDSLKNKEAIKFHLEKNGVKVQEGISSDMIFPINHVISYVSRFITLKMGDIIFTGTPKGVGPVQIGDRLTGYIEDRKMFDFLVK